MRHLGRSTVASATVVGLVFTTAMVALAPSASAATTLNVNSFADIGATAGDCGNTSTTVPATLSLREAICIANNGGGSYVINLQTGTYLLTSGELGVGSQPGQNVTLNGTGAGSTTISGQGTSRVLNFDPNLVGAITASVQSLEVTGGADSGFGGAGIIGGGAGSVAGDQLAITNSKIDGNHANGTTPNATNQPGGGVQFIGGVLSITNTVLSGNSAASSPGSAIAYQAQGVGTESFSMTGDTVTSNTGTNSFGPSVANGGAVDLAGPAGTSMSISQSTFSNNTMTGTAGPARGAALRLQNGTLSVTGSSFTTNSVSGTGSGGGAIEVAGGTATIGNNRIVGNTAPSGGGIERSGGAASAKDNWWGCNAGPGNSGCDSSNGTVTTNPRLVLGSAFAGPIASTGSATISADIAHDSAGATLGSIETGLDGVSMAFSSPAPSPATCGPTPVTLSGATAAGSCTFAANGASGPGQVTAHVDNQSITISFAVTKAPSITLQPADQTVTPGGVTFTAAADGYPVPTVQWQKSTDGGSTFNPITGATTTTLAFTAVAGDNGSKYRAVFTNSVGNATSNAATLTVHQAPSFTSGAAAPFVVGTSGSFQITTSGLPGVSAITETGPLPGGLTFTDNGNGTATIAGTPLPGTGGVSSVGLGATNGVAPDATQTLTITVNEAPAIVTNPSDVTAASGTPATFTAAASGFPAPTVQWQTSTDGGSTFSDIGGATSTTLSLTAAVALDGNKFRAVFTNSVSSATTTAATLTVTQVPGITSANSTVFTATSPGSFLITTSGHPTAAISTTTVLPGWLTLTDHLDGTATLAGTPPTGSGGTVVITLKASNGVVPDATQTFTLTVDEAPHISTANGATFTVGSASSFLVGADRGNPTPAFSEAEVLPSGLTLVDNGNGTATLSGTPATGTGGTYTVHITADNGIGSADVQTFTLTVRELRTITSADHTTFAVGSPGTFAVTTTGGYPAATTLSESGALPTGVTFVDNGDGTATLAGTPGPGTDGAFPIVITADNGVGSGTTQSFTLTVTAVPTITSADHTSFVVGGSGTFTVNTSPGYPVATALGESGALPSGVTFVDNGDGTATLAGTPLAATGGTYPITITATNASGHQDQAFTLTVREPRTISSADHTTFAVGSPGTFAVTTTGGYPAATTLSESGALPTGVTFVDNGDGTATLAGTPGPGTGGAFPIVITADNGVGSGTTQSFTLTVTAVPTITSADHTSFVVGGSGTFTVNSSPGYPVATTLTESGALPSGVTFVDNGDGTATLAGTPLAATGGTYPMTITATNASGHQDQPFTLTVGQAPEITSANQTTLTVGTPGTFTVTTTGFALPALSVSPALPAGLSFVDNGDGTATISGTPSAGTGGTYALTITAANGLTPEATQSFTLTINEAPSITSADHTTFGSGVSGTFTMTTGGFPAAGIGESGALPSGVQLQDNGDGTATLSGIPGQGTAGTYPITLTATNGIGSAATQSFTLTVSTAPQTVAFTSTAPVGAVVGSTYPPVATGGGSGNPVVLSIDPSATAFCSLTGSTVTFDHPGLCVVDANQAGNAQYAPGSATQSIAVTKAATSTQLTVHPASLTAAVAASAPGAGTPTGTVQFFVDGSPVGSAPVASGTATLSYPVPAGHTHNVSAVYSGDGDFTASSASTVRNDPAITASLSSAHPRTTYGWYRSPVTITFHCSANGAALTAPCPSPVILSHDGAGQSVARTIGAVDGGAATVVVAGISIDTVAPTVSVSGVRPGGSYFGTPPTIRCSGRDSLSGIATCVLTRTRRGLTVVVTATATDRAGNQRSTRVTYRMLQFYLLGASYSNGAFTVQQGHRYTVVALTPGSGRPRIYDAAPAPQRPRPADNLMNPAGRQAGLHRFTLSVYFERGMARYRYWNLGIMVGRTMHVVEVHPY